MNMVRRHNDVHLAQVPICERFALQSQLLKAGTSFHKEHLSLTDIHAMFKDSVSEHQPAEVNLNLSAVQSFFRGFNSLTSI